MYLLEFAFRVYQGMYLFYLFYSSGGSEQSLVGI